MNIHEMNGTSTLKEQRWDE